MRLIHEGKTKIVYELDDERIAIEFKDDVTGSELGADPGGNAVVGRVEGKGLEALRQSAYFFELLAQRGVATHFIAADFENRRMIARPAAWLGLEFVVRFKAYGSFVRRYGKYVNEGAPLGGLVEITLKDDERGDPLVVDETLSALGLMRPEQVREAKALVQQAADIVRRALEEKGLELVDIKFECGEIDGRLAVIDDISTDNMRVFHDGKTVAARQLTKALLEA